MELLSISEGEIAARNNDLEDAGSSKVDRLVSDASVDDYHALPLPGGTVNPIGTICHGPWTLLEPAS